MSRHELMVHLLQVILNLAIAVGRIADDPTNKARAAQLEQRIDDWLAVESPVVL